MSRTWYRNGTLDK